MRILVNRIPTGIRRDPHDPASPAWQQGSAGTRITAYQQDPCGSLLPCGILKKINLALNPLPDIPAVAPAPKELALNLEVDLDLVGS